MFAFSALLFLIPFVVDPALAALTSDFPAQPLPCTVVESKYILGASRCSPRILAPVLRSTLQVQLVLLQGGLHARYI